MNSATLSNGVQHSRFSVQNTGSSNANVTMTYINREGDQDFTIADAIPALTTETYDLSTTGSTIPVWTDSSYYNSNGFWTGAVTITSDQPIAAVLTNHWRWYAVAYNGASSGAQEVFVPSIERRYDAVQGWRGFSVTNVQCLETSGSCQVHIKYFDPGATNPRLELTRTIDAGAALGANTRNGGDWDFDDFLPLGDTFAGSAIVSTDNNSDVAVVAQTIRPGTNVAGAYTGVYEAVAGTSTYLSAIYQSRESCPPGNDWTQWSLIRIQNPTATDANDVDITYYNASGTVADQELNFSIAGRASLNRNTRVNCADINLGNNWSGSVVITSDVPLVAVVETLHANDWMASYNGVSR